MEKGAAATGREDARRTLETLKPKQAKELIAQMLEGKEIDEVVMLLAGMPEGKRAKIIAEFKTPAETEQSARCCGGSARACPPPAWPTTRNDNSSRPRGPDPENAHCKLNDPSESLNPQIAESPKCFLPGWTT